MDQEGGRTEESKMCLGNCRKDRHTNIVMLALETLAQSHSKLSTIISQRA